MKNKFFLKIFLSYVAIAAGMAALIMFFSYASVRKHYIEVEEAKLTGYAGVLRAWVIPAGLKMPSNLQKLLSEGGQGNDARFTIIATDGVVLADSDESPSVMDNHINRPEVITALGGKKGRATRYSSTKKEEMLYVAVPVTGDDGKVRFIIRASMALSGIKLLVLKLYNDIIKALMLILVLSIAAAVFFTRGIYSPIIQLVDASKQVSSGNFGVRVKLKEKNELKELGDNFNSMTEKINGLFSGLNEKREQLDAIISSVAEGLVVVDEKGKIVLANNSFKKISGTGCGEGNFYWECFLPAKFNETVETGIKNRKSFTEQLEIKNKVYLCGSTYMETRRQSAFVLYDITEFKDLERIKKDFVANVSHELKTPLTAIKGFAETLENETKNKDSLHYLEIIKKNTERLINIVNDLLTLSQLEDSGSAFEVVSLDLGDVINNAATIFEEPVSKKGLKLKLNIEKNLPKVKGDAFKLEQVFLNLIDNAVKYTDKGSVTVTASKADSGVMIEVADTGSGIPEEHLTRIFERFYVVDKSRSKKLGGTGLGLSIVKHIVLQHNGTITAKSEPGEGTVFTVVLPG